jgi:anti-sigma28 factor (negative regulator of flagellin synthesis)
VAVEIIQSIGPKELGPQKHIEGEKAQQPTGRRKANSSRLGDEVQISDRAKALNEEFEVLKARIQSPSEDLQRRIETARQRIASGFYFQDDVLEQVASKILDLEPVVPVSGTTQADKPSATASPDIHDSPGDKIVRAKNRAAEGFYQQNDVLKITAEKIIKDLMA